MSDAFHLQIISPSAVLVDGYVPMVEIPGSEGDFGVLPGHAPFFSMIRPGVISVQMAGGYHRRFFAAAGYADVSQAGCIILSDHIEDIAEISPAEATEALHAARQAVANAQSTQEKARAEKLLATAEALSLAVTGR